MDQTSIELSPIGWVDSCFKEKFGIPRQAGLVKHAEALLKFYPPYNQADAFEGLEHCTHIWVEFLFHKIAPSSNFKARVKPPRLGGNKSLGVFATRSPNRPNRLGLSVLRLVKIQKDAGGGVELLVSGVDLLDQTPIFDIKPYLPYADAIDTAINNVAPMPPPTLRVQFSSEASSFCKQYKTERAYDLLALLSEILQQDPRPQYHSSGNQREYGVRVLDVNVRWRCDLEQEQTLVQVLSCDFA